MFLEKADAEPVTLIHGDDRCHVLPHLGGSIASWTVAGQHMLRPGSDMSIAARDPYGMGSFPLVPFSNRIANGRFNWAGQPFTLARNFLPEPHAIHGVGFERAWQMQTRTPNSLIMALTHRPGSGWPWAFKAEQRLVLEQGQLMLELRAINLSNAAVPLAFGHHPYFPRGGASLQFQAAGVWLAGEDGLPSNMVQPAEKFDYRRERPLGPDIDHCFTDWDGMAKISWAEKYWALEISASRELQNAVVCIRSDADGFCFEPVPHINNAINQLNQDLKMPVIAPKEEFRAWIRLRAVPGHR